MIALVSTWLGYRASEVVLMNSLESVPLLEAKIQASRMSDSLAQMRRSLVRIAQSELFDDQPDAEIAQGLAGNLEGYFQDNAPLVQEITFKRALGEGFMLLRDKDGFTEHTVAYASSGAYSPLQQAGASLPQPGRTMIYSPVFFSETATGAPGHEARVPVLRMAFAFPDGAGLLILGVDLEAMRNRLAEFMKTDSPLRMPIQEGSLQLSFYFDTRGWILFEMGSTGNMSYLPDIAREGYSGDFGRAGYDAAFRPWTGHDNFWRMVTEVASGRSGSIPAPADRYTAAHVGAAGRLCFAPVLFADDDSSPATPLGGIAFFETSALPLAAFLRLANYFLTITVASLLIFGLSAFWVGRKLASPIRRMAAELTRMADAGSLDFIDVTPACEEQRQFQSALNNMIAAGISTRDKLDHISRERRQARSRLPVDLASARAAIAAPEFGLIGSSALIREVREHVGKAARAGTDVLVWGETGTGKELVAAAIHKASARSSGPYISINCGALDENLLLDALFGHVKGAFTEARNDRKGAFLSADGGTLHLDEVANASLKVQQSLLRALSIRRIRPLGTDEEIEFTTRVVAATNVDLRECVRAGTFREDLYYRLAIISIETPPLRHRKEDIPELAAFCIHDAAVALGRPEARLSLGALDLMAAHDWPGNVREFKNCLTRAMAFVEGDLILRQHITLEQDAYRTYAKPIAPRVLAEKIHSAEGQGRRSASAPLSGAEAERNFAEARAPEAASDGNAGHGPEPLWPPPGDQFAPARPEAPGRGYEGYGDAVEAAPPHEARPGLSVDPAKGLSERQLRALAFVRQHGEISRAEYETVVGMELSSRTAQNDLRELVERGILQRVGAGPGTRYVAVANQ
jgi:DNA-binding NtrC family response regulator